jgi:hypothetical protein
MKNPDFSLHKGREAPVAAWRPEQTFLIAIITNRTGILLRGEIEFSTPCHDK